MLSVFCSPSRYTQGKNATSALGAEMVGLGLGGPALIVASLSPIRRLTEVWKRTLSEAGIAYAVCEFGGECSLAEIERIKQIVKQNKSQVIVGAGGGKVLDAARAVAADLNLPIVNCPTVASSDSPCSALSVIYSDDGIVQGSRFHRKNADLVLVDTQVVPKVLPDFSWQGWVMRWRHGSRPKPALRAALRTCVVDCRRRVPWRWRLCYRTLLADGVDALRSVQTQVVTPALERLVEANTLLSGIGFESSDTAAAHAIHNGLTTAKETHDYLHGEKVAFGLLSQLVEGTISFGC